MVLLTNDCYTFIDLGYDMLLSSFEFRNVLKHFQALKGDHSVQNNELLFFPFLTSAMVILKEDSSVECNLNSLKIARQRYQKSARVPFSK